MATILTKKKDTTGAPSAGDLTNSAGGAELAVNTADKRLYTKNSSNAVVEVGTNPGEAVTFVAGSASTPAITTTGDTNTGIFFPAADTIAFATNGVERAKVGNSETVFNDGGASVDFRVEGDTDANLLFVDASTDRVGIGTNSPAQALDVVGSVKSSATFLAGSGTAAAPAFTFQGDSDGGMFRPEVNTIAFATLGAERMRIDNSGNVGIGTTSPAVKLDVVGQVRASTGILFGSDTAAANALDDYEEGTWTPQYTFATSGTATMVASSGTYTKIGRMVTVNFIATTSAVSSPTGAATITGLPFTSASGAENGGAIGEVRRFVTDMPNLRIEINPSSSAIILLKQATNSSTATFVDGADFSGTVNFNRLHGTITYFV
jgi:hypothetical protein